MGSELGYHCLHMSLKWASGPGCSKLTMSLVNISLKFKMFISEIRQYFLLKFALHFSTKNISVFGCKVVKHLTVDLLTGSLS